LAGSAMASAPNYTGPEMKRRVAVVGTASQHQAGEPSPRCTGGTLEIVAERTTEDVIRR
jgi:hypothetical protein